MNRHSVAFFAVTLSSVLLIAGVRAELPVVNHAVTYERCDSERKWCEVPKSEGEIVLACLRDLDGFKTWGSTVPRGVLADPIPTAIGFRVVSSSGQTNVVHFSWRGELVDCPRGLLVVPDREAKVLCELLVKWRKADNTRIAFQPLPCKYTIGTVDDGGTLSGIARLFYGDPTQWRRIYEANRTIIKNPGVINDGTVIAIPQLTQVSNKSGAANRRQPLRLETNSTPAADGSGR